MSKFFMNRTKWLGHEIEEKRIKPKEEKVEAILKLYPKENTKELKSFLGAIQNMAKFLPKLGTNGLIAKTFETKEQKKAFEKNKY